MAIVGRLRIQIHICFKIKFEFEDVVEVFCLWKYGGFSMLVFIFFVLVLVELVLVETLKQHPTPIILRPFLFHYTARLDYYFTFSIINRIINLIQFTLVHRYLWIWVALVGARMLLLYEDDDYDHDDPLKKVADLVNVVDGRSGVLEPFAAFFLSKEHTYWIKPV